MVIFMVFKVGVCRVTARLVFCDKFVAYFYLGSAVPKIQQFQHGCDAIQNIR